MRCRRAGGHAFFWPSGYQWCLSYGKREDGSFEWEDRARFEREAKPHAMIGKDGKVMLTNPPWYRGGEAATLCRGDQWSRDWLTGIAVGLAKRGGELFQIDQVVGAGMRGGGDCRATGHGHPPGIGIWDVEAAHRQMTEMHAACRAAGVNMVLGYEEPQELFLQEVGIQDYRDYEVAGKSQLPGHRPESVFGYLYHEFVPLFQSNPRAESREMTAHCIVTGQMPHLVPHWPVEPHAFPTHGGFEEWARRRAGRMGARAGVEGAEVLRAATTRRETSGIRARAVCVWKAHRRERSRRSRGTCRSAPRACTPAGSIGFRPGVAPSGWQNRPPSTSPL